MRFLALFLICASAFGQPVAPNRRLDFAKSAGASSNPDYTNNLYVDLESDTTASLGGYGSGSVVNWWTNIAPLNPSVINSVYSPTTTSGNWPTFQSNKTPKGTPCLDYTQGTSTPVPVLTSVGSNQPNTILMMIRLTTSGAQSLIDCPSGSRTLIRINLGGQSLTYCGSAVSWGDANLPNNQWFLLTEVLNGSTSYARTNGVRYAVFNPGTGGIGEMQFGNDVSFATAWQSQVAALRIYNEALSTNNLHTAEQNLASRYTGATLPSP